MTSTLDGFSRLKLQQAMNRLDTKNATPVIPGLQDTDRTELLRYLRPIQRAAQKVGFGAGSYTHGATVGGTIAYNGGIYSPTQNRIYFAPVTQSPEPNWHYVDCDTGDVTAYANGIAPACQNYGYAGGVYSPTQNRIYLVPNGQAAQASWHYIDCNTGEVVEYANGIAPACQVYGYAGGVYSPTQNRIYFAPSAQALEDDWHYIDCDNGTVHAYTHGATITSPYTAYSGGVYSPTQNRIYLVPLTQAVESEWHYIDCEDGTVYAYTHGATSDSCNGGVYSPTQNRIYLVPNTQSSEPDWHYIDCDTGDVVAYENGIAPACQTYAYHGGVYSPTENRIYLCPAAQATEVAWHYIDCDTGLVVEYINGVACAGDGYSGGIYSPAQNRVYLVPRGESSEATWHFIQEYSDVSVSRNLMAGALFNKF